MIYNCNTLASVYCIIFLFNTAATGASLAQSIAENTASLKQDMDAIKAEFVSNLQQAASNPENLSSGQTKVNTEKILQKIDSIQFRINDTSDLLSQKENALTAKNSLGEPEKLELKQALQAQRKPLEAYKQTSTLLKNTTRSLLENKLNEIHEVYKNYLDIAGPEQAKAKLEANIQAILAQYLPPKPKSTPATPDSISMPNLQSPLPESQMELEKVETDKKRLLKALNKDKKYKLAYKSEDGECLRNKPGGEVLATIYYGQDTRITILSDSAVDFRGLEWFQVSVKGWMAYRNLKNGDINIALSSSLGVVTWNGGGDPKDNFIAMRTLGLNGKRIAKVYHGSEIVIADTKIYGNYEWVYAEIVGWLSFSETKRPFLVESIE